MALNLKLPKLFGAGKNADQPLDLDMPTTQVRAGRLRLRPAGVGLDHGPAARRQRRGRDAVADPRSSGTCRSCGSSRCWAPLLVLFLVLAALMVFLDARVAAQGAAMASTATEMQMLSQRLARGTALAAQGQSAAFAAVKDSRDRFSGDLERAA